MNVYLSLGSNLGERAENLRRALALLGERVGEVVAVSSFHETEPVGFRSEHSFLNAAAHVRTELAPVDVLRRARAIEVEMGRRPHTGCGGYADRPIDIDLLFADDRVCCDEELELPHPRLFGRLFVLEPLSEIAPALVHPVTGQTVAQLLEQARLGQVSPLRMADLTAPVLERVNALLAQLSVRPHRLGLNELAPLAEGFGSDSAQLFLLRDAGGEIVGMATLNLLCAPTGVKAWVDDVVVHSAARGSGLGALLLRHLIGEARRRGAQSVGLTSRPAREAANRLYRRLGFELRETNVYQLNLSR